MTSSHKPVTVTATLRRPHHRDHENGRPSQHCRHLPPPHPGRHPDLATLGLSPTCPKRTLRHYAEALAGNSADFRTSQVLAMLAAKPQIIIFGLPGTASITAIRAIRAQNPAIPISECSACELPSFIAAADGPQVMRNIYILGSMESWLAAAQQGTSPEAKQTTAGLTQYFAGMRAAGYTSANQLDNSQEGWDAGLEIQWAIKSAGTLNETAVMHNLQHLNINTLGIVWARTPANYENITQVLAAMEIIKPDGSTALYK